MYSILCLFDYITLILSVPLQKATEENIFDTLDSFATSPSSAGALSELERYLSTRSDPTVSDPLAWWHDRRTMYPRLSRMALDYLTVPGAFNSLPSLFFTIIQSLCAATSVDVERTFSRARILLSHLRNCLSPQSTRALMCLNSWSPMGLVRHKDVLSVARLAAVEADEEEELEDGWDYINLAALD